MTQVSRSLAGIGLVIAACACFCALDTTTKYVSKSVPLLMALWARYMFQAGATALVVLPQRGWVVWRTRHLHFQLLRGLLLLLTSLAAFFSLRFLPVGEFTAIVMLTPLAMTVIAATVLKERVSPVGWAFVAGGFAGTLVVMRPGSTAFRSIASLLPLCAVIFNVAFQLLTSRLARTEDPITTHLYTGWTGAVAATLVLPFVWAELPDARLWLALGFMGLMGTVGHFLLILAFGKARASTLMPFLYTQVFFSMLAGWLVFDHFPDDASMAAMLLIVVCGAGGAWHSRREELRGD
ncbi:MAG TPA: DMT family transporter [Ramlibacter sp.]|uniref:DMT family transporter n=1 Tax=Ramlibacter sp. TaxID=1917967 RepID=UPI002BD3F1C6|nr:DMT family transporter [Ramlibacter sp.]HVZ45983.1 DMT family transporter [Ramlibacter sp.]